MNSCNRCSRLFVLLNLLLPALEAGGWPGFTWEQWRKITHVERPQATSPQAGQRTLLSLLDPAPGATEKIDTVHAWEMKRARIHTVLNEFVGQPQPMTPPPPSATELGREDAGTYERIHLRVASEADDTVPAYLLLPKERQESRAPVMIVLHQTQAPGKQEACGMIGDENLAFARELAERGMICLAPDAIGFGERIRPGGQPYDNALDLYRKHPQWSYFGKMNWDVARIVDYLETLGYIDPKRIGVIGHSHGAYGSIMAAVAEPRIALVVASCGYTTLRTDPSPNRWSHLTALLPRLGFYVDDVSQAPFDWHEIVACLAPRPYFNWATLNDDIFPGTDNLKDVYEQLHSVYALHGAGDAFTGRLVPGKHRFPPEGRQEAYSWIEHQFGVGEGR